MFSTSRIHLIVLNYNLLLISCLIISVNILPMYQCHNLICNRIPNLSAQQMQICQQRPEILMVIRNGVQMALNECQLLFQNRMDLHSTWNCSSWIQDSLNRLFVNITDSDVIGTKEASFAHALFAAAMVYSLSEACTKSNFPHCTCGTLDKTAAIEQYHQQLINQPPIDDDSNTSSSSSSSNNNNNNNNDNHPMEEWKWNGCTNNIHFGLETARIFMDSFEHQKMSPYSLLNLHNNNVGRKVIKEGFVHRCQCHGFSGSCTYRTCWRTITGFREATRLLYDRYRKAKRVTFSWLNKTFKHKFDKRRRATLKPKQLNQWQQLQKTLINITLFENNQPNLDRLGDGNMKVSKRDLIYLEPSIDHCDVRNALKINRTSVLKCWPNNTAESIISHETKSKQQQSIQMDQWPPMESCDELCCGKNRYRLRTIEKPDKCECRFQFCCSVICKPCTTMVGQYECLNPIG